MKEQERERDQRSEREKQQRLKVTVAIQTVQSKFRLNENTFWLSASCETGRIRQKGRPVEIP